MNKGLEVIEAVQLFGVEAQQIEVVVHRQSILHSAVELTDGAVIAQLGTPDMRLPIQYALTYPERSVNAFERLSLTDISTLTFEKPDMDTFVCLPTCINAINKGGLYPAIANGANEKAVELFLKGKIGFLEIGDLVSRVTEMGVDNKNYSLEDVFEADKFSRETVLKLTSN
jgi:1-deoxy-D-xylulose-5-phosphate reductoisomerase